MTNLMQVIRQLRLFSFIALKSLLALITKLCFYQLFERFIFYKLTIEILIQLEPKFRTRIQFKRDVIIISRDRE